MGTGRTKSQLDGGLSDTGGYLHWVLLARAACGSGHGGAVQRGEDEL